MTGIEAGVRRTGAQTREEILRVALQLFTEKGYESTSTRDIGEALGITKPALYYHFRNKEDIVASLIAERRDELAEFICWLDRQDPSPDLLERAAIRWIESTTPERLQLMLLAQANQPILRRMVDSGDDIRSGFSEVIRRFTSPSTSVRDRLLIRMTFDTVGAALLAANGSSEDHRTVVSAAIVATRSLARTLRQASLLESSDGEASPDVVNISSAPGESA